jgi:hypothetical protein
MSYIWEERTDLKGSELYCAVAIADHADADGRCFPGTETIARKMRLKERQVQDLIKRLEDKNVFDVTRGNGRGNLTSFQFKRVQENAPINKTKRVQDSAKKGAGFCKKRVQDSALPIYKEESFKEHSIKHTTERVQNAISLSEIDPQENAAQTEHESIVFAGLSERRLDSPFEFQKWQEASAYAYTKKILAADFLACIDWLKNDSSQQWRKGRITPEIVTANLSVYLDTQPQVIKQIKNIYTDDEIRNLFTKRLDEEIFITVGRLAMGVKAARNAEDHLVAFAGFEAIMEIHKPDERGESI